MSLFRLVCFTIALGTSLPAAAQQATTPMPGGFADLVEKLSPAVVNISTTQKVRQAQPMTGMPFQGLPPGFEMMPEMEPFREFFDRFGQMQREQPERELYSLGSGFVIDPKGYVITNYHVVDDAQVINVTFSDNSKYKAAVIGRDKKTDLALLKIEPKKDLPFVPMGDSDAMRVGDWVIAIGNPFGLGGSVTQGIISARQRSINAGPFDDFLQTDAPINRGNSGGPLFNTKGEVIGITTAIFSPTGGSVGIGFAIPTALAKPIIAQLKEFGKTHRGWLGVKIQEVSEEVANSVGLDKAKGALVLDVGKDSPADKAGLQAGDIITQLDGKDITEMRFLPRMVAEAKIGKKVPITYWRKNVAKTTSITIGELDEKADDVDAKLTSDELKDKDMVPGSEALLGMDLTPASPGLHQRYRLEEKVVGLVVVGVKPTSEAAKRGVQPGDVLVEANGEVLKAAADLKKAIEATRAQKRKFMLVKIHRNKEDAFVPLPVDEEK
ncbi:MAG: DegQ family serine endoprotease [Rickettsiales bacterium]|nr:DegQ family serine endoprotease [Rickettsiales bacterium]